MCYDDVLKIVGTAIASFGGAGAIVLIIAYLIWKCLAEKYIEKQKAEFQKEIETHKSELDKQIEGYKFQKEQLNYISKVQYDIEITTIKDLTEKSFDLMGKCAQLYIVDDKKTNDASLQKGMRKERYDKASKAHNAFIASFGKALVFISDDIYEKYDNWSIFCYRQIELYCDDVFNREYDFATKQKLGVFENTNIITEQHKEILNAIKDYLKSLKVE